VPLWGFEDESDPRVMEKKIAAAASHGVNVLIFDWYWYDNKPFLEDCINKRFLGAKNNKDIQFFLMWANHNAGSLWNKEKADLPNQVVWPGAVDRKTFDTVADRVIAKYMCQPNYYKIDGKPVFSIYELGTLISGLGGRREDQRGARLVPCQSQGGRLPGASPAGHSLVKHTSGLVVDPRRFGPQPGQHDQGAWH